MGKPTLRMIGSNILFDIAKRKSELFEVKVAILWHSPFTLINNSKDLELINTGEEIVDYEIIEIITRNGYDNLRDVIYKFDFEVYGAIELLNILSNGLLNKQKSDKE